MLPGENIRAAIKRGQAHEATSTRRIRVRFSLRHAHDLADGLHIFVTLPARNPDEFEKLRTKGYRFVPFGDLDAGRIDLVRLVDDAVAEIESALDRVPS